MGVLVDDLIRMGTAEPYRMFTSRAEYRLILREDNADQRLTEKGRELGLVNDYRWEHFCDKREAIELERQRLKDTWVQAGTPAAKNLATHIENNITHEYSLYDLLKRPELNYTIINSLSQKPGQPVTVKVAEQIEIEAKYSGYITRQQADVDKLQRHENTRIPTDFNYSNISGLSNEIKQKLSEALPETLARASRVPGVTPAAISLLLVMLKKHVA
jgi:tRNA uridine 5-carboxymethylaminomethyl modification enzyme